MCLTVAWCNFYSFTNLIHSDAKAIDISRLPTDTQTVLCRSSSPTNPVIWFLPFSFSHPQKDRERAIDPQPFLHTPTSTLTFCLLSHLNVLAEHILVQYDLLSLFQVTAITHKSLFKFVYLEKHGD